MNSFRRTGSEDAFRAAVRSSRQPPKPSPSVKIESAAAPDFSYPRTISAGSEPGRISPAEGLRLLNSAINRISPGLETAAKKSRG